MITARMGLLVDAQMKHALGIGHVYTRDEKGRYSRVTKAGQLHELLENGIEGDTFFIFAKDPSVEAAKLLFDRAMDRPKEQAQEVHVTGSVELTTAIAEGRARAAARNRRPTDG